MTDIEVAEKLKLLLHFRGTGKAGDKEYQELHDVIFISFVFQKRSIKLIRF
jgi:hypothetical protein